MEKKIERRKQREERRKAKRLKRLANREADEMNQRIMTEEKILLKAQRKLEAVKLLGELFSRIKVFTILMVFETYSFKHLFIILCLFQSNIISKNTMNNKSRVGYGNADVSF